MADDAQLARDAYEKLTHTQRDALRGEYRLVANPTWGVLRRLGIAETTHAGLGRRQLTPLGEAVRVLVLASDEPIYARVKKHKVSA